MTLILDAHTHTRRSDPMHIQVNTIPPEGLQQHASYDPASLDMERLDIHLREPFEVDAHILLADQELVVTAAVRCPLHLSCARCLEEFASTLHTTAVLSYKVQPTDAVDITEDVRQEIMLAYPMRPMCRPDCRGLCGTCGQNLNLASCGHEAASRREP